MPLGTALVHTALARARTTCAIHEDGLGRIKAVLAAFEAPRFPETDTKS